MQGREFAGGMGYRWGFGGQEGMHEVTEMSVDYGARNYNTAIGRWLSRDPNAFKYPAVAAYAYSLNSPILFSDADGRDAIIRIIPNSNGLGGTIVISSTTYITGVGASPQMVEYLNQEVNAIYRTGEFVKDGKLWLIDLQVQFKYDENVSEDDLGYGENMISISGTVSSHTYFKEEPSSKELRTSKTAVISLSDWEWTGARVAAHELLHLYGISDRYSPAKASEESSVPHPNWEYDIMGQSGTFRISDVHFQNLGRYVLNKYGSQCKEVVHKDVVDQLWDNSTQSYKLQGRLDQHSSDYLVGYSGCFQKSLYSRLPAISSSKPGASMSIFMLKNDSKLIFYSTPAEKQCMKMKTFDNTYEDYKGCLEQK